MIRTPAQPAIGVTGWGGFTPSLGTMPIFVVVNETNPDIKLMGIAYHYVGDIDVMDVSELQKSALYDARRGAEVILIKASNTFIAEMASGLHFRTNYVLLAVPAKLGNPQFSTLRQAFALGIKTIWGGTGPP
jgi:hypothetical protein